MIAAMLALKRLICRVLIGVLLPAQFAVAAYACPIVGSPDLPQQAAPVALAPVLAKAEAGHSRANSAAPDMVDMGQGASASLDSTLPNLCLAHCQFGQQKADHTPAPNVAPALLTSLYVLPPLDRASDATRTRAAMPAGGQGHSGDPPHAILHCCLRD